MDRIYRIIRIKKTKQAEKAECFFSSHVNPVNPVYAFSDSIIQFVTQLQRSYLEFNL
jgi:hypothetical protein